MSATIEQLTSDALTLSETERALLAQTLLRSLELAPDENAEEAWDAEVARRLDRVRQGVAQGRPADEVFRDLRARHEK
jgi:putative addiction module component (TIGR02574 family)